MWKKCTPVWREAHVQVKSVKNWSFEPLFDDSMAIPCQQLQQVQQVQQVQQLLQQLQQQQQQQQEKQEYNDPVKSSSVLNIQDTITMTPLLFCTPPSSRTTILSTGSL